PTAPASTASSATPTRPPKKLPRRGVRREEERFLRVGAFFFAVFFFAAGRLRLVVTRTQPISYAWTIAPCEADARALRAAGRSRRQAYRSSRGSACCSVQASVAD